MRIKTSGTPVSPGIVIGEIMILEKDLSFEVKKDADTAEEKRRFINAVEDSKSQLEKVKEKVSKEMGDEQADIFGAHLMVLDDPELIDAVETKIDELKLNAEAVLDQTIEEYAEIFENMDNEYMRERAADIRDVGSRIMKNLLGRETAETMQLEKDVVLTAADLSPSDTAQIDSDKVLAFVTRDGGRTSHTAIIARSMELPAVVGAEEILNKAKNGDKVIVDGIDGDIIIEPDASEIDDYQNKAAEYELKRKRLAELKDKSAETSDGHKVELAANIAVPKDVDRALENGAEGIGLFRSEFLYMDRNSLPSEEEQFEAYKYAAEKMDGPVIIRTLDVGGDKEIPYLNLADELNPFLGYRAIRVCLDKKEMFKTQLRAILRAASYGDIKIMYPMVSSLEELIKANEILAEAAAELSEKGISHNAEIEKGIMIEIPSAALTADILAEEADFFSIGTNDLIQYTTAVDRMNDKIADLYQPYHPALLRLIKSVVDAAHKKDSWVGMCGEAAGNILLTPFLLGIGLDEFSMSSISTAEVKEKIRGMSFKQAEKFAAKALQKKTAAEVKEYLKGI